jgi:PAS domain S-box-containing protein
LPHIFEPFYRASARETDKGGVGLGLTITRWIVSVHDGDVQVESTPGVGSTFTIRLPWLLHDSTPTVVVRATQEVKAVQSSLSSYLDNPFLRAIATRRPITLWVLDTNGMIVGFSGNPSLTQNIDPAQLIGISVFDAFRVEDEGWNQVRRALRGEIAEWVSRHDNRLFENFLEPIFDTHGLVMGVIVVSIEITERRRAAESFFYLAGLLEHISEAIFLTDMYGTVVAWNQAAQGLFGWAMHEAVGQPIQTLLGISPAAGGSSKTESTMRGKDGSVIEVLLTSALVYDKEQTAIGIIGIVHDISDRKRLERDLRAAYETEKESGRIRAQFISIVSHEFRAPLASMLMSVDMLRRYADRMTPERRMDSLNRIVQQIDQMDTMIEELLKLTQNEINPPQLERAPIDLHSFCHQLCQEIGQLRHASDQIACALPPAPAYLITDARLLRQILSNLLINALKYAPEGQIHMSISIEPQHVRIEVRDHGIGIPAEDLPRLFEGFYRGSNVGDIPGTGLGLMIVKRAVDALNGQITVESELGAGTRFTILLPL